ncbi:MAG: Glycyl-tRNA synthetase beta chain (EC [uncultured Campylobacterales bacterium]|uniref:Glycine--tRNA ligase beta subunit n=1 Tax=uncultured Campylobacterales bacterium TaxID=352960 RepID=A0A6S6T6X4_9BACT|nr:MAG: Glycyl-tRNA synthetase beta chain (EC [uncultured Campylobacterales bacterium]
MYKELLIEIGVEELPAIPFLKEYKNIKQKWQSILSKYNLNSEFEFNYTPRRLVLIHNEFPLKQSDVKNEIYGAPTSIAYKDGVPTNALNGFLKKNNIELKDVSTATKNGKEVLFYEENIEGKKSSELIGSMIEEFLFSLNFGKSMRWGKEKKSFIRPIRWVNVVFEDNIDFELFGVKISNHSYPHRDISYESQDISSKEDYFLFLENNGVILDENIRKEKILKEFKSIEEQNSIDIEIDNELLDEVVAITEYPTALLGEFDEKFLQMPSEIIIISMKEHQRYFPVFKDAKLTNKFIVVSNSLSSDKSLIVKGNEKVLLARLDDGLFFYENDKKSLLQPELLKNVLFMKGLGSVYDKQLREQKIAKALFDQYKDSSNLDEKLLSRAVELSKADLNTEVVCEFDKLQGLIGSYYAEFMNEEKKVVLAIKEQYLPIGQNSELPSTLFSAIVALSIKIDTLFSMFSIGKVPTGSSDPFALRRAVIGIIKTVLEYNLSFDFRSVYNAVSGTYETFDFDKLDAFVEERIYQYFDTNNSIIASVLKTNEKDIYKIAKKIEAIENISKQKSFKENFSTFKRVSNIIKDLNLNDISVDISLLKQKEETILYNETIKVSNKKYDSYQEKAQELFGLKPYIDDFFENIMVNAEDEKLKTNRQSILGLIYKEFLEIADIKEISI